MCSTNSKYIANKNRGYKNKLKAIESKGGKCLRCIESRPATLCFHHKDPKSKSFELNIKNFYKYRWEAIVSELDKCDLLCHNCHSILHCGEAWDDFEQKMLVSK